MRALICGSLIAVFSLLCSGSERSGANPNLTVLLDYEHPYSQSSFDALQNKLQSVLGEVGLQLNVRNRKEASDHEEFAEVVLFNMKGHCSMDPLPVAALSDERGALAMAFSTDGSVLPFGSVQCDHIRESLEKLVGRSAPERYQVAFGSALGLVMAHEIYHMLAHSGVHTKRGVTKESLSARELLEGSLSLPEVVRIAMRQNVPGRP